MAVALGLPLAASAGPLGDVRTSERALTSEPDRAAEHAEEASGERSSGRPDAKAGAADEKRAGAAGAADDAARSSSPLLGVGLATAAACGPEVTSPDGIEAQTCVLTQGEETWARTYYRNGTGRELSSVLSMMAPGGHTVRMHCAVGAEDEPGACETPRERTRGGTGAYTAVAEFAAPDGGGPLLLRSGSNSRLS
ncbi:hypothetical protein [Streptomyces adelaidensis]|uniref:hypothetical protein n=1 Tax=Streptomyces adelaidensis TaxID=2796465 RepID=UPI001903FED5|nr:hypothetical protein [Streptomyces adelaidensis]